MYNSVFDATFCPYIIVRSHQMLPLTDLLKAFLGGGGGGGGGGVCPKITLGGWLCVIIKKCQHS